MFSYAQREDTYALAHNPVTATSKRRELPPAVLDFFEPEEIEALARAAQAGAPPRRSAVRARSGRESSGAAWEDRQDAELYRVAAYTGMRLGELLALRWEDVDLDRRRVIVHRAVSAGVEGPTKSRQARALPLADVAAGALARLAARGDYTGRDDYVFCSRLGRRLDRSAVRRRYDTRPRRGGPAATALPRAAPRRRLAGRTRGRRPLRAGVPRALAPQHDRALPAREAPPAGRRDPQPSVRRRSACRWPQRSPSDGAQPEVSAQAARGARLDDDPRRQARREDDQAGRAADHLPPPQEPRLSARAWPTLSSVRRASSEDAHRDDQRQ